MSLASPPTHQFKSYIGGEWYEAVDDSRLVPNLNPATGEKLGDVIMATREDTQRAIDLAQEAFHKWREVPSPRRGDFLFRVVRLLEARKEELARALTMEEGKVITEARGEVQKAINAVEFAAGEGRRLGGHTVDSELPNNFCYTVRQPLGVVGIITPWNFPVAIPLWKMAPCLVSGNTIVFKPATNTPWTACLLMEIFHEAGLPPGVVNMVLGPGRAIGDEIVTNPKIRAISFTGSTGVGMDINKRGAERGIKIQCEMGGKNPIIILEDADLDLAVEATVQGAFGSTGQRCTATSRAIVVEDIADQFVEKLVARTKKLVVGNGMNASSDLGPSVDQAQFDTVLEYIEIGKGEGLKLLAGGSRLTDGEHSHGFFVEPTIFDSVKAHHRLAQEEVFGPVLSVIRVKDFDEAIEVANNVEFGLSSSLYTRDINRVFRYLNRIETGITHVNSPTMGGEAHLPFGGLKNTGLGGREQGREAIDFYTEFKTVYIDYTGEKRTSKVY